MNTHEFRESYEIDRNAKGMRANEKPAVEPVPVVLTADDKPFNPGQNYFYVDQANMAIRESQYLRRIDPNHLGDMNVRLTAITALRANRDDAVEDLENILVKQIEGLREKIRELEAEKSPDRRTVKFVLMARG